MIPENFIVSEALAEGIRILQQSGPYAYTEVVCVEVETLLYQERVVPAIRAVKSSDIDKRDRPSTYMFFGDQATGDEGGVSSYVIMERPSIKDGIPLVIPDNVEAKYLSWDWEVKP